MKPEIKRRRVQCRLARCLLFAGLASLTGAPGLAAQLLVPMDREQENHLKAYGYAFGILSEGQSAEWLLNYRAGSFLVSDAPSNRRRAALMGVTVETLDGTDVARIRREIETQNMETVPLEKAPTIAVYTPPNSSPWDDAVTMALEYAEIPYERIWDREVLSGELENFDWLHLHHEDFTGQYSKFYLTHASSAWLQEEVARNEAISRELGFPHVPALKKAVAARLRDYVEAGGFLFAMCTATETLELALAAAGIDIAASYADGSPLDAAASNRLRWAETLAFRDAVLVTDPTLSAFSDIDGHQVNTPWRVDLGSFSLFESQRQVRSGPGHAHPEPPARAARLLRPHHDVSEGTPPGRRHRARGGGGARTRQIPPRELRRRHLHVPRGARSGRPPPPDRRCPDGPGSPSPLRRLSAHSQQRPVPGREEEEADHMRAPPRAASRSDGHSRPGTWAGG